MWWLSSWFVKQDVRGSIPGLDATISKIGYILRPIWLNDRVNKKKKEKYNVFDTRVSAYPILQCPQLSKDNANKK